MYTSTFTFGKRAFDDEFDALDNVIAQVARTTPGYLGDESCENPSNGLICMTLPASGRSEPKP